MARVTALLAFVALTALLAPTAVAIGQSPERWIVQVESGVSAADVAASARSRLGVVAGQRYTRALNGFAATMTEQQRDALAGDPRVRAIVRDRPVQSSADPYPLNASEVQPGVRRVGSESNAQRSATSANGTLDVDIAVLDTGIQTDNHELNVVGGYNCTDPANPSAYGDGASFGHGTHVAGIAAARHNGRGVAGVAQGARLWAIKVLQSNGNGYWSWVICGLDRVAGMTDGDGTPTIEVVNMSLAARGFDDGDCGRASSDLLHQAVCRLNEVGVTMVAAAGNESSDAAGFIPAAYDEVITVSAMADWNGLADGVGTPPPAGSPPDGCSRNYSDDAFGAFSNFGRDVDVIAPGTCVLSTLPVDRLGLMTGTSMATPHVAGGAALYHLAERAAGRGRPTPEQVRAALVARGTLDWLTATDRDRNHAGSVREPALFVGDFTLDPFFDVGTRRQVVRSAAGSLVSNEVWIARVAGFGAGVDVEVLPETLPPGAEAQVDGTALSIDLAPGTAPGSYDVKVRGAGGSLTDQATFRIVVFNAQSDPGGPVMTVRTGLRTGVVSLPLRVSWPAVANARRYMLARRVDGGSWVTIGKPYGTGMNVEAVPGVRYQYRVRAKVAGVWRSWLVGPSQVARVFEAGTDLGLAGAWQAVRIDDSYGEVPVVSSTAGARASLTFDGRSVGWISSRGPTRGRARVRVDGVLVTTIDLRADTKRNRMVVFGRSWTANGRHTLRIDVLGMPTTRPSVVVDALVVVSN